MKIEAFAVERWMDAHETRCRYNLAETCVESLTVGELLTLGGRAVELDRELKQLKLTYGAIPGSERLRALIAALYQTQSSERVLITHGAAGANALVYETLIEPGDEVVTFVPNYQQHVSIPAAFGANVRRLSLRADNDFLPDLAELSSLISPRTKLIAFSNPNNPTGALMPRALLERIVAIADSVGAYVLADEVYRGIDQEGSGYTASAADLYERALSTGSMSKAYSLAGLRLGWIVASRAVLEQVEIHRDYNTISVGMIDDMLACLALEQRGALLQRNRAIVRRNLAHLHQWIDAETHVSYVKPKSGTTALVKYDASVASYEMCVRLLESTGVLFTPGSAMSMEGYVRIGYANNFTVLADGLALTSGFLRTLI